MFKGEVGVMTRSKCPRKQGRGIYHVHLTSHEGHVIPT